MLIEGLVLVVSLDSLKVKVLSVVGDVLSKLVKGGLDSGDLGNEDVIDHIASIEDISGGGIDLLLESDTLSAVDISSSSEILNKGLELLVEISNELIDSVKKVLEGSLGVKVNLSEVYDPRSPLGLSDLVQELLLIAGESLVEVDAENGSDTQCND